MTSLAALQSGLGMKDAWSTEYHNRISAEGRERPPRKRTGRKQEDLGRSN